MPSLQPWIYRHYKGNDYEVLGVVLHTETDEPMVLYKALYEIPELKEDYGDRPLFVRPYAMFTEDIEWKGELMPRFVRVHR